MKKTRFFYSVSAVMAAFVGLSAMSVSASAADVVDFEDGNYSFVSIEKEEDSDSSLLSIVDFNGSKQLKVDVQDCKLVPRVRFDLNSIIDSDKFDSIKTIELDLTFESKDGVTPPGWAVGAIGTQGGTGSKGKPNWGQTAWECSEYEKNVSEPITVQRKFLLYSERLVNGTRNTRMVVLRQGAEVPYNMYIDNIRFLDSDGNVMQLDIKQGKNPVTTTAATTAATTVTTTEPTTVTTTEPTTVTTTEPTTVTTTEPATVTTTETTPVTTAPVTEKESDKETEDTEKDKEEKPESDEETTPSTTGNLSVLAAASAVMLSGYAVGMTGKKHKK